MSSPSHPCLHLFSLHVPRLCAPPCSLSSPFSLSLSLCFIAAKGSREVGLQASFSQVESLRKSYTAATSAASIAGKTATDRVWRGFLAPSAGSEPFGLLGSENEEEVSLLKVCHVKEETSKNMWYLDTGCNDHMCGDKSLFSTLDESIRDNVKFGDNFKVSVMGKGENALLANNIESHFQKEKLREQGSYWKLSTPTFVDLILYLMEDKSKALIAFKSYKVMVEKEAGCSIQVLRTDRGGEYNSYKFTNFCEEHDIKRQLTTPFTPQQNGVCERKNRTIMNMVRSLLTKGEIPKKIWPEAVNWSVHILNESPTLAVQNMTPEEAWSGRRPNVSYFKIFGAAHHIPTDFDGEKDEEEQHLVGNQQQSTIIQADDSSEVARELRSPRLRRRLAWMRDYEVTGIDQSEDPLIHFALFADCDPTKLKENGEVDKYKARLVAKGYKLEFGIDYKEVFAPFARHNTIRLIIALAAQNS
ncbi:uncharacterized protein LOC131253765 [Magnolia sinica]|uniref:uncharacterized protein LOC131253765 n=1 Tax=Magnolia sinica TaxID=86752 RepID=UPI002657E244|nr:uncharacterized protein LOC131253765 [Magnolia sinica]